MEKIIWILIIILLVLIEVTKKNSKTMWFAVSGIFALIAALIIKKFIIEFAVFIIGGIILLKLKPFSKEENLIGKKVIVTKKITKSKNGEIKINNKTYIASSNETIKINEKVEIIKEENNILKVKKIGD